MKIIPAKGVTGHIICTFEGGYYFRAYNEDYTFTDYKFLHCDLEVTIQDIDAALYIDERGARLSHSPETLGITE